MKVVPEIDMPELLTYAKQKNVGLILWMTWKALADHMDPALELFEKWGVKGIKVDFMQRDDQWMVNFYEKVLVEAATHKLLVDFHGAYKPCGFQRTYPNFISNEGVKGNENNKWSEDVTPQPYADDSVYPDAGRTDGLYTRRDAKCSKKELS